MVARHRITAAGRTTMPASSTTMLVRGTTTDAARKTAAGRARLKDTGVPLMSGCPRWYFGGCAALAQKIQGCELLQENFRPPRPNDCEAHSRSFQPSSPQVRDRRGSEGDVQQSWSLTELPIFSGHFWPLCRRMFQSFCNSKDIHKAPFVGAGRLGLGLPGRERSRSPPRRNFYEEPPARRNETKRSRFLFSG